MREASVAASRRIPIVAAPLHFAFALVRFKLAALIVATTWIVRALIWEATIIWEAAIVWETTIIWESAIVWETTIVRKADIATRAFVYIAPMYFLIALE